VAHSSRPRARHSFWSRISFLEELQRCKQFVPPEGCAGRIATGQRRERLQELGKQQGGLTPNDLHQVLDVDRLSTDELSDMLVRLEQAGVSVEIDPALLAPASGCVDLTHRPVTDLTDGREPPFTTRSRSEAPTLSVWQKSKAAPSMILFQPGSVAILGRETQPGETP
jgi:hypothetical protein